MCDHCRNANRRGAGRRDGCTGDAYAAAGRWLGHRVAPALKAHLGLDEKRSWVVITETNDFVWPGFDLRPVPSNGPKRFDHGILPPRFFAHLQDEILRTHRERRLRRVSRDER